MNKKLNSLIINKLTFNFLFLFSISNITLSQCLYQPCFCIEIDEIGQLSITWDTTNISSTNLFEHQFYADTTGNGFVLIGSESNPNVNSFNFQNYFAGNNSSGYYIKSLYGPLGANSYYSDTIYSIYFDLVNLFDGRVALSWNQPFPLTNHSAGSQYVVEKSSPVNPPTSANWTQVITLPTDSTSYTDNISVCSDWINYRIRLNTVNCDFISNLDGGYIEDQPAPDPPIINSVTNDTSNNQLFIDWNSSIAQDVMAYIIFKFSNGAWNPIDTIYGLQNTTYYDTNSSSFQNDVVQYAIAAMDSCSSGIPPQFNTSSAGLAHNNILLSKSYDQCSGNVELSWNEYINWPLGVANYYIFMRNDSTNNWELLDSTNSLNYSYTVQQGNMNYQFIIEAKSDSLNIKSNSNVIDFYANQPPIPQLSYISEVDVLGDTILVKYLGQNGIGIQELNIYRSNNDGIDFTLIDQINNPTFPLTYYDIFNNSIEQSYVYHFSVIDSCLNEVAYSNFGKSIYLTISSDEFLVNTLSWNRYLNWANGVLNYHIFYKDNLNPNFQLLASLDSLEFKYFHDFNNLVSSNFDGRICYQVIAEEFQNSIASNGESRSNIFCIQNEPLVFVPNAISLSGTENYWKPVINMIDFSEYSVSIFNRLGALIFNSDDINEAWYGTTLSNNFAPMGVYVYQIEFKNSEGKYFHKKGHITLIP